MNWDDIKPWVAKVAPMLGTALGGPLGGMAGAIVGQALGIKDATPASIDAAIKTGTLDADHIVALKVAEQEFTLKAQQMGIDSVAKLEELAFKDRDSARNREIQTKDITPRIIAGVIVFGFLWSVWFVLSGRVQGLKDPTMVGMVGTLIGYISAKTDTVIGYYFGSSAGSDRKTEIIQKAGLDASGK